MKHLLIAVFTIVAFSGSAQKIVQTKGLKLEVDDRGKITSLYGDQEYLPDSAESYLVRVNIGGEDYTPISLHWQFIVWSESNWNNRSYSPISYRTSSWVKKA